MSTGQNQGEHVRTFKGTQGYAKKLPTPHLQYVQRTFLPASFHIEGGKCNFLKKKSPVLWEAF